MKTFSLSPKHKVLLFLILVCFSSCSKDSVKETNPDTESGILLAVNARPLNNVVFEPTSERLERGKYLVQALWCTTCHTERDTTQAGWPPLKDKLLSGAIRFKTDSTHLYAPNLTPDKETGIGEFTDDMLARAIREGVGHDGRGLVGAGAGGMPWPEFRTLSDEDLASIIVYIRSIPAIKNKIPKRKLRKDQEQRFQFSSAILDDYRAPFDMNDPASRGRYLIRISDCRGCHYGYKRRTGILAGGEQFNSSGREIVTPNITSDLTGVGGWTEETFISVLRNGKGKSGEISHQMPWISFRNYSDEDLAAIYQALMSTYPVKHLVLNNVAPTYCEVCEQEHGMGSSNKIEIISPILVDQNVKEEISGLYQAQRFKDDTVKISLVDGQLFFQLRNLPLAEMLPLDKDRYWVNGFEPLLLTRDETGKITEVTMPFIDTFRKME